MPDMSSKSCGKSKTKCRQRASAARMHEIKAAKLIASSFSRENLSRTTNEQESASTTATELVAISPEIIEEESAPENFDSENERPGSDGSSCDDESDDHF